MPTTVRPSQIAIALGVGLGLGLKDASLSPAPAVIVQASFTAAGDVSDYTPSVQTALLSALAAAAGFSSTPAGARLTIVSQSVLITASFPVMNPVMRNNARAALAANVGSQATLQAFLTAEMGAAAPTVQSAIEVTIAGTFGVAESSPPPPPPPPPAPPANTGPFEASVCQRLPIAGRWMDNFGTSFVINGTMWLQLASWGSSMYRVTQFTSTYAIMQNPANDAYNPSLWTKAEFHNLPGGSVGMCMTVYNAATEAAALAANTATVYNTSNPTSGCNGFGHTVMTRYTNPLAGSWTSDWGTAFTISDHVWHESSSWGSSTYTILGYTPTYLIVQNPSTDAYNPSLWSKIEFHNRVASVGFRYCTTVYDAATWAAAYSTATTTIYNTSNAAAGCNGFGHTIVTARPPPPPPPVANMHPFSDACSSDRLPIAGRWMDNFGTSFVINGTMWLQLASWGSSMYRVTQFTSTYAIMQNPANDAYNPSLWTKAEFHNLPGGSVGMCMTVYNAATEAAALAANTATVYNTSNPTSGCNGFGHTVMTRYTNPLAGSWTSDWGTAFTISDHVWHESSSWGSSTYTILGYTPTYLIVQNPSTDAYNPSLWSKIEFHNRVASVGFRYCTTVYDAATWAAAYSTATTTIYNTSNAAAGCNGFGHTIATANVEGR